MTWGSVWFGCLFAHPRVIVTASFLGVGGGGRGDGACGTSMLKMAASCFSAAVCFNTSYGMKMYGAGFLRASVRSAAALFTASSVKRIGKFFFTGKSYFLSDTHPNAVLGMFL